LLCARSFGNQHFIEKPYMDTKLLIPTAELLEQAAKRVKLPAEPMWIDYDREADSLYIKISQTESVISRTSREDDGVAFDYDKKNNIVGIEILDLYGIYAPA
jgi:uncharacterized protein YuzE